MCIGAISGFPPPAGRLVPEDRGTRKDQTHASSEGAARRGGEETMRLGIIGAGNIGATLATLAVSAGHDVSIANSRGPLALADVADRLHAVAPPGVSIEATTVAEAAKSADVVILAIPFGRYPELPEE